MEELERVLASFNLPEHRKYKTTPHNLKWLLKNIRVRNANNPKLQEAENIIKGLLKK
jgi:hypothetical protein